MAAGWTVNTQSFSFHCPYLCTTGWIHCENIMWYPLRFPWKKTRQLQTLLVQHLPNFDPSLPCCNRQRNPSGGGGNQPAIRVFCDGIRQFTIICVQRILSPSTARCDPLIWRQIRVPSSYYSMALSLAIYLSNAENIRIEVVHNENQC